MKHIFYLLCFFSTYLYSQVLPPYINNFDGSSDTAGWYHSASGGTDEWEWGVITYSTIPPFSSPNVWATNLDTFVAHNSQMYLYTPSFDFTGVTSGDALTFYNQRDGAGTISYYIQYSSNNGANWYNYSNTMATASCNWATSTGFSLSTAGNYQKSSIRLNYLAGQPNVQFRFRFSSNNLDRKGWIIDNFSIGPEQYDVSTSMGDTIQVAQTTPFYGYSFHMGLITQYLTSQTVSAKAFFSYDTILDPSDIRLLTSNNTYSGNYTFNGNLPAVSGLNTGTYYLIHILDSANVINEFNELNNLSYSVIVVDSTYNLPYSTDLETDSANWLIYGQTGGEINLWQRTNGYRFHIENSHSGNHSWHTSLGNIYNYSFINHYVQQSIHLNLQSIPGDEVFSFWYQADDFNEYPDPRIEYCLNTNNSWFELPFADETTDNSRWKCKNIILNSTISNSADVRFRFKTTDSDQLCHFDDLYIGPSKPDLSIEKDKLNRSSNALENNDTIKYYLSNCGLTPALSSITTFYWSTDEIFDIADVYLGSKIENSMTDTSTVWSYFSYVKPLTNVPVFYIFYQLDSANVIDEMREYNNMGCLVCFQDSVIPLPYQNDFETSTYAWRHNTLIGTDEWICSTPNKPILNHAFSGNKAWLTNDTGSVSLAKSYLYTPVFDFSTITDPVLQFNLALNKDTAANPNITPYAGLNMSYSIDHGATWSILDTSNISFSRWHYRMNILNDDEYFINALTSYSFDENLGETKIFTGSNWFNSRDVDDDYKFIIDISQLAGIRNVQFRFNAITSPITINQPNEGAMIDDFIITQAYTDLLCPVKKHLLLGSQSERMRINMSIKNNGNYITIPTDVDFYLSADTILDGSDPNAGSYSMDAIRPDFSHYISKRINLHSNFEDFNYLLYQIDPANLNSESNELNNIGYWYLDRDSISTYPYICDFSDTLLHGWDSYTKSYYMGSPEPDIRAINYPWLGTNGYFPLYPPQVYLFPEYDGFGTPDMPYEFIETPTFDFSTVDSIIISFDQNGGASTNMDYSTDGIYWHLMTDIGYYSLHWYTSSNCAAIYNEPCWPGTSPPNYHKELDLRFLKGLKNIRFRYKMRASYSGEIPYSWIDNFRIDAYEMDLIAGTSIPLVNADIHIPTISVNYEIFNNSTIDCHSSNTYFYWSTDTVLDSSDVIMLITPEATFNSLTNYLGSATMPYIQPITQFTYYVLYKADGDDTRIETNENNNIGKIRIDFNSLSSLHDLQPYFNITVNENTVSINSSTSFKDDFSVSLADATGKTLLICPSFHLQQGNNQIVIPQELASGVYYLNIRNSTMFYTKKLVVIR